jgi:hypothetical protein
MQLRNMQSKLYLLLFHLIFLSTFLFVFHRFFYYIFPLSCRHVFLRLFHGKDSFGDDYETELNGKDLFLAFGPLG